MSEANPSTDLGVCPECEPEARKVRESAQRKIAAIQAQDPRIWRADLKEAGWKAIGLTLYQAPCGCFFRGPFRAWIEMNGTHVASHVAMGNS